MKKRNPFMILSMITLSLLVTGCVGLEGIAYHHNGVTDNMIVIGSISIREDDKSIVKNDVQGVRAALIIKAEEKYGKKVDNVVDIEQTLVKDGSKKYYVFSGIAVIYK